MVHISLNAIICNLGSFQPQDRAVRTHIKVHIVFRVLWWHLTFIELIPQFIVAVRILNLNIIFLLFEYLVGIVFCTAQWSITNSFSIFMVERGKSLIGTRECSFHTCWNILIC